MFAQVYVPIPPDLGGKSRKRLFKRLIGILPINWVSQKGILVHRKELPRVRPVLKEYKIGVIFRRIK